MEKNKYTFLYFLAFLLLAITASCNKKTGDKISFNSNVNVVEPVFKNKTFNILDYGAIDDGVSLNTHIINKAITVCSESGGGKVIIPKGIWVTGPIELKSNVNLFLENGATILYSDNFDDYPLEKISLDGYETYRVLPLIYGKDLENIAITGNGIFDGTGQIWRPCKKMKYTDREWKDLTKSGGVVNENGDVWWPDKYAYIASKNREIINADSLDGEEREKYKSYYRPNLMQLINCNKILLDGPTFQNSPAWNLHPLMSRNITINNITVRNPWNSQNGDGLDLESCSNVRLYNSTFDVGDDAICIKSGRNEQGRKRGMPTENVDIQNCIVYHGHGGFVIGSEMSGGVRNIWINNCTFIGTDVGLRFKSTRGRGGVVENIYVEGIKMIEIKGMAFIFNLFYANMAPDEAQFLDTEPGEQKIPEVTIETPEFRKIYFRNIVCNGAETAIQINGLPEMPVNKLYFEDVAIKANKGIVSLYGDSLFFKNVNIINETDQVMKLINTSNVVIDKLSFDENKTLLSLWGKETKNIIIKGVENKSDIEKRIFFGKGVPLETVSINK